MNMFKKIFKKKPVPKKIAEFEGNLEVRLLVEIAYSDGDYSDTENKIILDKVRKNVSNDDEAQALVKKIKYNTKNSTSLYPTINEINKSYDKEKKMKLLKDLWQLIAADSFVHTYEESLYFQIAELIKIKRSAANEIKVKNS